MNKPGSQRSSPLDALQVAANRFSLDVLNHSFQLLRYRYPSLALLIQNLTASHHSPANARSRDCWIPVEMSVEAVSEVVTALSVIAEEAADNDLETQENRLAIHHTLLDWLMYAQSFLEESAPLPPGQG